MVRAIRLHSLLISDPIREAPALLPGAGRGDFPAGYILLAFRKLPLRRILALHRVAQLPDLGRFEPVAPVARTRVPA